MLKLSILVLLIHLVYGEYDDKLSRTKFFPLAAAAYNDKPEACIHRTFGNDAELVNTYSVICDPVDLCFTFLALSHSDKAILIGFRGSMSATQLLAEGIDSMLKPHVEVFGSVEISEYFYNAFNLTWNSGLQADILELATKHWNYEIWISGHSLGGAIASIAATAISYEYPMTEDRIKIITYGQPRIGDFSYAMLHNMIVPNSYRVTHRKDLVVNLPPMIWLYFFHHKSEVFFDNDMENGADYKICEDNEDFSCSIGKLGTSVDDHTHYYGQSVSGFGDNNCA